MIFLALKKKGLTMCNFNFDEIIDRHHSFSDKWDILKDPEVIPLWVADMDFKAAPAIYEAVNHQAQLGTYGYGMPTDEYYQAIVDFHKRHYNQTVKKEWVTVVSALVPAVAAILQALCFPGDEVLIQSPAYNCFYKTIKNAGLRSNDNNLIYKDGKFTIDFDDLEEKASHTNCKVLLFCNPHNPSGRLWTREELLKVIEICKRHNITIISDEVHCDIKPNGSKFIALTTLDESYNDHIITLRSGSKTFNIAGLKNAYFFTQNQDLLYRITRQAENNEICDVPAFGFAATVAAYTKCDEWIVELNDYIQENYQILKTFFKDHYPKVNVAPLEATYLAWVDCSSLGYSGHDLKAKLLKDGKLLVNDGETYHSPYPGFLRINLGCPHSVLKEALQRFKKAIG